MSEELQPGSVGMPQRMDTATEATDRQPLQGRGSPVGGAIGGALATVGGVLMAVPFPLPWLGPLLGALLMGVGVVVAAVNGVKVELPLPKK